MREINYKLEREDVVNFVVRKLDCFVDNIVELNVEDMQNNFGVHISNDKGFEASLLLSEDGCEVNVEKGNIEKNIEKLWARHIFVLLHKGSFHDLFEENLTK